jgi:hypothetical protein
MDNIEYGKNITFIPTKDDFTPSENNNSFVKNNTNFQYGGAVQESNLVPLDFLSDEAIQFFSKNWNGQIFNNINDLVPVMTGGNSSSFENNYHSIKTIYHTLKNLQ